MTGCSLKMFCWKIFAASPYSSNMPVLSASMSLVAISAGVAAVLPAIGAM